LVVVGVGCVFPAAQAGVAVAPRIVFESSQSGDFEIWTMRLDGSGLRNLTRHKGYDESPAWSPDGRRIAFTSTRTGRAKIWVMNADGSRQRQVTRGWSQDGGPSWSPDGSRIVYGSRADGAGVVRIWSVRANGGKPRRLTQLTGTPTWSPDGKRVVFASACATSPSCLYVMNADGTHRHVLGDPDNVDNRSPAWSPDGRLIAWIHATELWVMNVDGSAAHRLPPGPVPEVDDANPTWSPDGSRVLFESNRSPTGLAVINLDGSGLAPVGSGVVKYASRPDWQPVP